jgi:hypothetical protein
MDEPPPTYPFGLPVGVDEREWEARRAMRGKIGLSMAEAEAYRQNYIWPAAPKLDQAPFTAAPVGQHALPPPLPPARTYKYYVNEDDSEKNAQCMDGIWLDAPNPSLHEGSSAWYSCVKRWRLEHIYGTVPEQSQMILEVGTNAGTVYRHIIFLDQVANVVTKMREGDYGGEPVADTVEEVIIDIRNTGGWAPTELKLRCMGSANSLALHRAIVEFLGCH